MVHVLFAATAVGSSHIKTGRTNEDSYAFCTSADGRWMSAVVCDGCGSVAHAREGAELISNYVANELMKITSRLEAEGPSDWVIDVVVAMIAALRESLRSRVGRDIRQHAATIVAALISDSGGFILHIGDGIASAFGLSDGGAGTETALEQVSQSKPENGEYINETFYVTEPDWIRHVRITPVRVTECLLLCSDGAQPLWFDAERPNIGNLTDCLKHLFHAGLSSTAPNVLNSVLISPDANRLSHDDKTAIFVIREGFWAKIPTLVTRSTKELHGTASALGQMGQTPLISQIENQGNAYSSVNAERGYEANAQVAQIFKPHRVRWPIAFGATAAVIIFGLVVVATGIFYNWEASSLWHFGGSSNRPAPSVTNTNTLNDGSTAPLDRKKDDLENR